MKRILALSLVPLLGACASNIGRKDPLFDGKDLKGWKVTGKAEGWVVDGDSILCTAKDGGYLYTEERFGDFELDLSYRTEPGVNSGIFFRWSDLEDPVNTGIEMQILDTYGQSSPDKHAAGAIYDIQPPLVNAVKPAGQWNFARIRCEGSVVECWLNDQRTGAINLDDYTEAGKNPDGTPNKFRFAYKDLPREGHIGFQDHGGKVWFKDITIRRLR